MFSLRRKRRIVSGTIESGRELLPDEILLDSRNIPDFDQAQFEGKIEKRISEKKIFALSIVFILIGLIFTVKVSALQIVEGDYYAEKSENNRLKHTIVFADRGLIYDRNKNLLAWNEPQRDTNGEITFPKRSYIDKEGFGQILGYVSYPKKDKKGFFFEEEISGKAGIEKYEDEKLRGERGLKISETDALNKLVGESVLEPAIPGEEIILSIDGEIQAKLYELIKTLSQDVGFQGGASVIMDIESGEILSLVSYPEFDPSIMSEAKDKDAINSYLADKRNPFLDRVIDGLYTPGSIVKPFVGIGVLEEGIIDPRKEIISTGSIKVPNPYNPAAPSIFNDWKAHGAVDLRRAIAVSSDVYFYVVGGGFGSQKGLGIEKIENYMRLYGFGESLSGFFEGGAGTIPSPAWKEKAFPGDPWRVGDTYFTSIGQYGFQVSPIQSVRAVAALTNGGYLLEPSIEKVNSSSVKNEKIQVDEKNVKIVLEGMRQAVTEGTAKGLDIPGVKIGAKTGTAELGVSKAFVNSWNVGFFPYDKPRYAYATIMERGDAHNTIGALYVMRQLFDWMVIEKPEYLK